MERQIRFLESEIAKNGIKMEDDFDNIPPAPQAKEMVDLEAALEKMDHELREINVNADVIKVMWPLG